MKPEIQYVHACVDTWKQEIDLSRSCSDLDAADNRLSNKLAAQVAQYPATAGEIEAELHIVGANDLWPIIGLRAARLPSGGGK